METRKFNWNDILDKVAAFYPDQFNSYKMDTLVPYGKGADAFVFLHSNGMVFKFTKNEQDASVSEYISGRRFSTKHLVDVNQVYRLPYVDRWLIIEERLTKLPPEVKNSLNEYFHGHGDLLEGSYLDIQISGLIGQLANLGLRGWAQDCLMPHNLLLDTKTNNLKAIDFGYTSGCNDVTIESW